MTRPRGFTPWRPARKSLELVSAAHDVLDEYADLLPLTLRQVFYRLVAQGAIDKTERGYARLCEVMNRARRAEMVPMDAIRDDGTTIRTAHDFDDEAEANDYLHHLAANARMDLQRGQSERLEVWCEAAGMVPQLQRVAHPYGVPVISSGGFDSLTAKYETASRYDAQGATTVLHLGDYDPSGVHIFKSLAEDIQAFTFAPVVFIRLAVRPEQIEQYGLPTAPPKKSDNRAFNDTRTVQAEAFDPAQLASLVRYAIEARMDMGAYSDALEWQAGVRERLAGRVAP